MNESITVSGQAFAQSAPMPGTARVRCRFPLAPPEPARASPDETMADTAALTAEARWQMPALPDAAEAPGFASPWDAGVRLGTAGLVGTALVGCATMPGFHTGKPAQVEVEPLLRIESGAMTAATAYAQGKRALQEGRNAAAMGWFEQAMALDPQSADAYNGKLVALARSGRVEAALAFGDEALRRGLQSDEMEHNLGLLRAREQQARPAAPVPPPQPEPVPAPRVEPALAKAALASLAPPPVVELGVAVQPPVPEAPAAITVVAGAPSKLQWIGAGTQILDLTWIPSSIDVAPAVASAAVGPVRSGGSTKGSTSASTASSTTAYKPATEAASGTTAQPAAEKTSAAKSAPARTRIEVSNGAGVEGLARRTARMLAGETVEPARITNHRHFKVAATEIRFRDDAGLAAARALARQLAVPVTVVQDRQLAAGIDMRVVLGRDVAVLTARGAPLLDDRQRAGADEGVRLSQAASAARFGRD
jgi:hypothetical protein